VTPLSATPQAPSSAGDLGSVWQAIATPSRLNFVLALTAACLIAALAPVLVLRRSATYQSQATLLIDQPTALATAGDGGFVEKLSRLRLKYSGIATTDVILEPAAASSGIPVGALRGSVHVLTPPTTLTLVVVASGRTPEASRVRSTAVANELIAFVTAEETTYNIAPANRFEFRLVNAAGQGTKVGPSSDSARSASLFGGLVGLAGAYVALQLVTARRRNGSAAPGTS
jgi:hypothetical protein